MNFTESVNNKNFTIDVTDYSRHLNGTDAPLWWGIIGLILIEMSVVAVFVVSYFYLQMINPQWPPQGYDYSDPTLPSISLLLLLLSCVTMYFAGQSIKKNNSKLFVIYTFISVALATAVLALRWQQIQSFQIRWDDHVYGSLLWTITGFHFLHVVSAAIGTAVIGGFGVVGFFNVKRQLGVVVDTLYWNFVALAWIPFYLVLYWAPRVM